MLFRYRFRIYLLGVVVMCCFGTLLVRLYSIQIERNDEFKNLVPTEETRHARVPGVRGEIRDIHGNILVENDLTYELVLNFKEIRDEYERKFGSYPTILHTHQDSQGRRVTKEQPDMAKIVNEMVVPALLRLTDEIEPFNARQMQAHWHGTEGLVPYSYPMELDFAQFAAFAENSFDLPGVTPSARPKRHYKYGALGGHLLGYVQEADIETTRPGDLKEYDYYVPDEVGGDGVEKTMDSYLRGKPGRSALLFDEKGRFLREKEEDFVAPTTGADVYLTLDADIQYITEMALRKVTRGAAVVIDPNTGNILAMASVPSFEPQKFIPAIDKEDWDGYTGDLTAPLLNRALRSFAPGSTFKIPVALAGCRAGVDRQSFYCAGSLYYGNLEKRCWIKGKGIHGSLFMPNAIKVSCNTFFYQYGNSVGINGILETAEILGFGEKTGIPVPGEFPGRIPGPKWLRQHNPRERWGAAHTANVAIGQGDTEVTPLQMAAMTAAVANGGRVYQPRLVDRVIDPKVGSALGTIRNPFPVHLRHRLQDFDISDEQIETVRRGMWEVVNGAGGTARRAKSPLTEISGKTGTAQFRRNGEPDNHAWFIGFAPYDRPQFAVCVLVEGGKAGGTVAAPITRKIIEDSTILYKNRRDRGRLELVAKPLEEAQGSFDFTELVSFDETLPPDALGDEADDGGVVAAREAPRTMGTQQSQPTVRNRADAEGRRVASAVPPKKAPPRKALRVKPQTGRRGIFNRRR